jgi:hypothetical protein
MGRVLARNGGRGQGVTPRGASRRAGGFPGCHRSQRDPFLIEIAGEQPLGPPQLLQALRGHGQRGEGQAGLDRDIRDLAGGDADLEIGQAVDEDQDVNVTRTSMSESSLASPRA